ncbi:MAG: hypothetical protein ACD_75C01602G0004 [uncultured bacterium]|nr:MAG: hypothetical protein ACD_75C01602G0004 [uncultured bacterium]
MSNSWAALSERMTSANEMNNNPETQANGSHKTVNPARRKYYFVGLAKKSARHLKIREMSCVSRVNQLAYSPKERGVLVNN